MARQSLRWEVGVHPINSIQHVKRDARENSVCVCVCVSWRAEWRVTLALEVLHIITLHAQLL